MPILMDRMKKRALPSLVALRNFEAAARHASFRRASEELSTTESSVSHQIARLEASLGVRLFLRTPRGVELSQSGRLYYPFLREAFEQIEHGTALVRRDDPAGGLKLQIYVTVAVRWLIPRLHRFKAAYPDILVSLDSSMMDWEFNAEAADLGIVYTTKPDRAGLTYTHLLTSPLILACAPHLASTIRAPGDLTKAVTLEVFTAPEDLRIWAAPLKGASFDMTSVEKFDSYLLAIEAAVAGQGVLVVPEFMVHGDLEAGRLAEPLKARITPPGGWYLVIPNRKRNDRRVQRFKTWLQEEAAEYQRQPESIF
jgi:LysR family transcriptional regulator, glycine cleavage system transcriptional activator